MKRLFSVLFVVTALAGCGSSPYKYFGKSYAPTVNAEMFFREADIPEPFEIMGKMDVKMSSKKSTEKIQRKVMQIAASKGADAVIIDNFDQQAGGFTSVGGGGGKSNKHGGSVSGGVSKTKINQDVVIKATLVKYKKNIPGTTPEAPPAPAPGQ
ncbi:MAG TPA: hypothetical protein VFW78_07980 [Bacteroidia bacterium]|nr:hypothetical protein [Bacteroidia bacterium]